eukprot:TRINITY_DN297_c0_g1_i1.p1 TRINITY_DN297_c0_g1~~TRINITY_DN297_c0_g1_i1.p1  ORF type:complete len:192 (+),score=71.19 TRINITY_DN297_c0_g1_i1:522-1097(+)
MVRDLLNTSLKEIAPRASLKELKDIPLPTQPIPEPVIKSSTSSPVTKPPHPAKRDASKSAEKRRNNEARQRNLEYELKVQTEANQMEIAEKQQKHAAHLRALAKSHKSEINDICMEHAEEVEHLKKESKSRMEAMEVKVKEAADNISELEKRHRRDIERMKKEHERDIDKIKKKKYRLRGRSSETAKAHRG